MKSRYPFMLIFFLTGCVGLADRPSEAYDASKHARVRAFHSSQIFLSPNKSCVPLGFGGVATSGSFRATGIEGFFGNVKAMGGVPTKSIGMPLPEGTESKHGTFNEYAIPVGKLHIGGTTSWLSGNKEYSCGGVKSIDAKPGENYEVKLERVGYDKCRLKIDQLITKNGKVTRFPILGKPANMCSSE